MSNNETYNGWTNRETWLVNVWYDPETKADVQYAKEFLEESYNALENGCLKDMLNLGLVNWAELEEAMDDDED